MYSSFQNCIFFILSSRTLGEIGCLIQLQYLLTNFSYYHYHLPFSSSACMKMWKLETTAKAMSAYKNSKETVGHYFERISIVFFFFFCRYVGLYTLPMSNFIQIRLFEGRIILFSFNSRFYIKAF